MLRKIRIAVDSRQLGGTNEAAEMIDTHYMYRPAVLDPHHFADFALDVQRILDASPPEIAIRGEAGVDSPEISPTRIALNGDRSAGLEHEPLIIEQTYTRRPPNRMRGDRFFDFCKTNGKPYDRVVVAILYALAHRFPSCTIASDSSLEELKGGFDLFCRACMPSGDIQELFRRPKDGGHAAAENAGE